jgi:hypothetical protein
MRKLPNTRRNVLKMLSGCSTGLVGSTLITGAGSARSISAEELNEEMADILETANNKYGQNKEKYKRYLSKNGLAVRESSQRYTVTQLTDEEKGPGPQYLDKADLLMSIVMAAPRWEFDCSDDTVFFFNLDFDWSEQDLDDWGEDPKDVVSLGWNNDYFYIPSYDSSSPDIYKPTKTQSDYMEYKKSDTTGIAWEFADEDGDGGMGHENHHRVGVGLKSTGYDNLEARQVVGDYWHLYEGSGIQSISFSTSGDVSVTVSSDTGKWHSDQNQGDEGGRVSMDLTHCE